MENSYTQDRPVNHKLRNTIKSDFKKGNFWNNLRREFRNLKDFYIDAEKCDELKRMNIFSKAFFYVWWIFKSMILKLTTLRRILLLTGIVLIFVAKINIGLDSDNSVSILIRGGFLGGAIILFVLMLELKDKLIAKDELDAGRQIQNALKPEECPQIDGWSAWLFTKPANEVGGDFVDFLKINNNRIIISVADVAGKGMKAALLTTKLQATVRALAANYGIENIVGKVNEIFRRDSLRNIFASLLYLELKPDSGQLAYVNAGHIPPVIVKSNTVDIMPKGEPALGLFKTYTYSIQSVNINQGDIFVAYSDGLTEARNEKGFFYGNDRFVNLLSTLRHLSPEKIGNNIISEVEKFTGDAPVNDDLSVVILKRL